MLYSAHSDWFSDENLHLLAGQQSGSKQQNNTYNNIALIDFAVFEYRDYSLLSTCTLWCDIVPSYGFVLFNKTDKDIVLSGYTIKASILDNTEYNNTINSEEDFPSSVTVKIPDTIIHSKSFVVLVEKTINKEEMNILFSTHPDINLDKLTTQNTQYKKIDTYKTPFGFDNFIIYDKENRKVNEIVLGEGGW